MLLKDHYRTLRVSRSASKELIRKSYLALAKRHHPDINPSPAATTAFKHLQEAYSVLRDDTLRREYDAQLGISRTVPAEFVHRQRYRPFYCGETFQRAPEASQFFAGDARRPKKSYGPFQEYYRENYHHADMDDSFYDERPSPLLVFLGLPLVLPLSFALWQWSIPKLGKQCQVYHDSLGRAFVRDSRGMVWHVPEYDRPRSYA